MDSTKSYKYYWRVLATDYVDNSPWSSNRTFTYAQWNITFNVTGSQQNRPELPNVNISYCNYTGFNQGGDTTNPYGPYGFPPGGWTCTFEKDLFYDKTQTFTADSNKIIDVTMSLIGGITYEEHTWLEALYNCIILGECRLYDLLLEINQTVGYTWQHIKPTDESVITTETEISRTLNSTSNISYEYTVSIPIKAGYSLGTYLPVRIGFWFMDGTNESCYSQGTLPDGVTIIEPYCNPLMVEALGPMGGSVSFRVDLRPNLTTGTYNVKRIIEIDPNNLWEGYGQEVIGQITVTEDMTNLGSINLNKLGEVMPGTESEDSSGDSSTGKAGGGSPSITNIYQNITNIIIQQEEKEESEEEKEGEQDSEKEKEEDEPEEAKEDDSKITGAATGVSGTSPLIGFLIMISIIVIGLGVFFGYLFIKIKS